MAKTKFQMPDGEIVEKDFPQFKTPWNHDTNFESDRTGTYCTEPSLTKQEFKDEADINVILARVLKTGELPPIPIDTDFADLTERTSYFEMASRVADANEKFYLLPPAKRSIFQNDPTRWADAVVDATNKGDRNQLKELGIDVPPEKPQVVEPETPPPKGTPAKEVLRTAPEAPKGDPKGQPELSKSDNAPK